MKSNRRNFLKTASAAVAGGYFAGGGSAVSGAASFRAKNEQPVMAFIGAGIRFHTYHGPIGLKYGPCGSICDVDSVQAGRALQVAIDQHRKMDRSVVIPVHEDYRRVLDRKDIDVVFIGTVDHWHTKIAIDAMRAGKDVYCEKPVTLTIREGQQILQVQKETNRVIQVGTQQRTEFGKRFAQAVAMVRDNRVGKMKRVTVAIGGSRESGSLPIVDVPKHLNWDMWLGQCPLVDYREAPGVVDSKGWGAGFPFSRTHRYYRWFYEYSGGKLTDWGAHHVDIALWALDKLGDDIGLVTIDPIEFEHPVEFKDGMPTADDQFNCATSFKVKVTFADGVELMVRDQANDIGFDNGIMFTGEAGRFLVNRGKIVGKPVEELKENPLPEDAISGLFADEQLKNDKEGSDGIHVQNFFNCVKSRDEPASDMQSHHRMLNICHAVNIALRLGRKLTFDPKTETFVGDELANSFVEREQRKGYEIVV